MNKNKILGDLGENVACKYLQKNKYKIIEKNFRCKFGEIDIIAKKNKELIFIEIKTRKSITYGLPVEAITHIKQKHMYKTAQYFLYINKLENICTRFDAIEIYKIDEKNIKINHIKDIINDQLSVDK